MKIFIFLIFIYIYNIIYNIKYFIQCASAQARLRAEFKHISKRSAKTETN